VKTEYLTVHLITQLDEGIYCCGCHFHLMIFTHVISSSWPWCSLYWYEL